jgi:hypothetical protein
VSYRLNLLADAKRWDDLPGSAATEALPWPQRTVCGYLRADA